MAEETTRIIVCGDSFNIGIGCNNLDTEPYASLLAAQLNYPLINLAKGSSSNLSIWLQVKYAVENLHATADDIILVAETTSERFNWFPEGADVHGRDITNLDVNYHEYPPYGPDSYNTYPLDRHPMQDHPAYQGRMITENVRGVIDYLDNFVDKGYDQRGYYYNRLVDEPVSKLRLIKDFYASVYNEQLSQMQSRSLMTMAHSLLRNLGIRHIMLLPNPHSYNNLVLAENTLGLNWGELTLHYPDTVGSGHASPQAHQVAAAAISNKLKENGWIQ